MYEKLFFYSDLNNDLLTVGQRQCKLTFYLLFGGNNALAVDRCNLRVGGL